MFGFADMTTVASFIFSIYLCLMGQRWHETGNCPDETGL